MAARVIAPARRRGLRQVTVRVRDIHDQLQLKNKFPAVCSALQSEKKFLTPQHLRLEAIEGPASHQSPTVVFIFGIEAQPPDGADWFASLRGIFRGLYDEVGGGEAWLRKERRAWGKPTR
ncbi:MAG: hypothetical protein ACRD1Y_06295 [Terriglobales bacterium]